ncbi:hypothetical protein K470DRAFT_263950 [Piedraia hortae CBS 480.64]|uniref:MYND-type domain-containing protein n=1 Tax=Piedraia hortae CBS 480.64 TaxID=1314780 RepID=A0A6A7C0T3_9PEZI|nr:hypothetical protein K470DRAFT_263950 [Piedraia hortae CBS 480.64]
MAKVVAYSRGMIPLEHALPGHWIWCKTCERLEWPGENFETCSRCLGLRCCSKRCQFLDWSKHRVNGDSRGAVRETLKYLTERACKNPGARMLAAKIDLTLPEGPKQFSGFTYVGAGTFTREIGRFWDKAVIDLLENIIAAAALGVAEDSIRDRADKVMDPHTPLYPQFGADIWGLEIAKILTSLRLRFRKLKPSWKYFRQALMDEIGDWERAVTLYGMMVELADCDDVPIRNWTRAMIARSSTTMMRCAPC